MSDLASLELHLPPPNGSLPPAVLNVQPNDGLDVLAVATADLPPDALAGFSVPELVEIARSAYQDAVKSHFLLADASLSLIRRHAGRAARGEAVREFAREVGVEERVIREHARIAVVFTPDRRERTPSLSWGHLRECATRTHQPGETLEERRERAVSFAERVEDQNLGVRGAIRLIETELRPERPEPAEELANAWRQRVFQRWYRTHGHQATSELLSALAEEGLQEWQQLLRAYHLSRRSE